MNEEQLKERIKEELGQMIEAHGIKADLSEHHVEKLNASYDALSVTPEGSGIGVNANLSAICEAKAIGIKACNRYNVGYFHSEELLESMVALKEQDYDKYARKMKKYLKWELIILDDFLLHTITDERDIKILFELLEKRNEQRKSTIVCSQRDPASWKAMILNDEVSANSIMKRVTKHYTIKINTR